MALTNNPARPNLAGTQKYTGRCDMTFLEKATGCLVGGAYGDSLGAAVEFLGLPVIRAKFGEQGIERCAPAFGHGPGVITDDTQMAIATAYGLIDIPTLVFRNDIDITQTIWRRYKNWLLTQSDPDQARGPGNTCLSALESGRLGNPQQPLNKSSGCGGIMRVHPVGIALAYRPKRAFEIGLLSAAITHGHPNAYVPAGALAMLISLLMRNFPLEKAVTLVIEQLELLPKQMAEGTLAAIDVARNSIRNVVDFGLMIDSAIKFPGSRGGGWQGHDALAIALYAALVAQDDPLKAVWIAVNHSGDSDSTGSITGAILGAIHGPEAFYGCLKEDGIELERRQELEILAKKLVAIAQ